MFVMIQLFDFNLSMHYLTQLHVFQLFSYGTMHGTCLWWSIYEESYEIMHNDLWKLCMIYEKIDVLWTKADLR